MSVPGTVSEIFSVKEWHDLETGGRGCSRSLIRWVQTKNDFTF